MTSTNTPNTPNTDASAGNLRYLVVKEGGSSTEAHQVITFDTEGDANDFRYSCSDGSYRTSPPIKVPAAICDAEGFGDFACALAEASYAFGYPTYIPPSQKAVRRSARPRV